MALLALALRSEPESAVDTSGCLWCLATTLRRRLRVANLALGFLSPPRRAPLGAREAAGLRELYGFSLLAGDAEEAAVAPPATTLAPPVVAAEPYIAAESTVAVV